MAYSLIAFMLWCSYVLASYARFLWDAEEEEEEEAGEESFREKPATSFFEGVHSPPPLAAAS